MLQVKTPEEVLALIRKEFSPLPGRTETVPYTEALGRVLAEDITAEEYVPDFNRSTVDGYACRAADTFGCSDAIPAILTVAGEVQMGRGADFALARESCAYVPTGGAIPSGADCAVMIEYTEDYGDGTVGMEFCGRSARQRLKSIKAALHTAVRTQDQIAADSPADLRQNHHRRNRVTQQPVMMAENHTRGAQVPAFHRVLCAEHSLDDKG